MSDLASDSAETVKLLGQVRQGDWRALDELLVRYRPRLRAFIDLRLDRRVQRRLDPSDVVQETQMCIAKRIREFVEQRIREFVEQRPMPFHLWARKLAYERLLNAQRDHRAAARRSVDREVALPDRSSLLLARPLLARGPSVSQRLAALEYAERVAQAVGQLSDEDRELLLMRHVEELPYKEIACVLDIEPAAARKRYGRALLRLRRVLIAHRLLESHS